MEGGGEGGGEGGRRENTAMNAYTSRPIITVMPPPLTCRSVMERWKKTERWMHPRGVFLN